MILTAAATLLAATLLAGPERAVSAPRLVAADRIGPVYDVAVHGDTALAVWSERRTGDYDVFAARLTLEGEILDPSGIRITHSPGIEDEDARVVWDGTSFVVAWTAGSEVRATRIGSEGSVKLSDGRLRALVVNDGRMAAQVQRENGCVFGRVFADLTYAPSASVGVRDLPCFSRQLAAYGDAFVVLDSDLFGLLRAQPVDAAFVPRGPAVVIGEGSHDIVSAGVGDDVLVSYGLGFEPPKLVRLGAGGSVKNIALPANLPEYAEAIVAHADGSYDFFVRDVALRILRFSPTDELRADLLVDDDDFHHAAAAVFGTETFYVWNNDSGLFGRWIGDEDRLPIARRAPKQQWPAIATDGSTLLVTWTEGAGGGEIRIVAQLVRRDGTPAGDPVVLSTPYGGRSNVVFDGREYVALWSADYGTAELYSQHLHTGHQLFLADDALLESPAAAGPLFAWTTAEGVRVRRLDTNGDGFAIPGAVSAPALTTAGDRFLLAANGTTAAQVTVLDADGRPVSTTALPSGSTNPDVAYGERSLAVYERDGNVYAGEAPLGRGTRPRVAFDGVSFVIVWQRDGQLLATRLGSGDVTVLGPGENARILPFGNGSAVVVYERVAPEVTGVARVFTRLLSGGRRRAARHSP